MARGNDRVLSKRIPKPHSASDDTIKGTLAWACNRFKRMRWCSGPPCMQMTPPNPNSRVQRSASAQPAVSVRE